VRLADERGFSLTEMLVVVILLGTVMGGLSGLFTSGLRAQDELNQRFQSQSQARVALERLRTDGFCAFAVTGSATSITFSTQTDCDSTGTVKWCTAANGTGRYKLLRLSGNGTCATAGRFYGDYLTTGSIFAIGTPTVSKRAEVKVDLRLKQRKMKTPYRLCDVVVLRNSPRAATTPSSTAGTC
jgi:prepilin-type N-terminal cleavage/methylation domain-containing protein